MVKNVTCDACRASNSDNRAGSIILYHIITVPAVTAAQLVNGQKLPTALSGYNLTVSKTNPTPTTVSESYGHGFATADLEAVV